MDSPVRVRPPPDSRIAVSAIVVFFRSEQSLDACLGALGAQSTPPSQIVVVCNSPLDEHSAARIVRAGGCVVAPSTNVGFGAACNAGAAVATGDYLLFVNPDVRCDPGAVDTLARAAASGAIVGPAIRDERGRPERSVKSRAYISAAVMLSREAVVGRWLHLGSPRPPQRATVVDVLSGACLMMRREVFEALGGFDERYFLYGEDVDLSCRARRAGIARIYEPAATVVHASGTGGGGACPDDETLVIKGREARRAHALLLEDHGGPAARRAYVRGLRPVLRARRAAAQVLGRHDELIRSRAALEWLTSGNR